MDAIALLKEDHRTVKDLFRQFERTGARGHKTKRRLVDKMISELSAHAAIEEDIFYPEARAAAEKTEDTVLESLEEHHIVEWTLSELKDMNERDERFDAKVTVLIELVRDHIKEEEGDLFPQVRKAMSRSELQELGERMEEAKRSAPREPKPKTEVKARTTAATPSSDQARGRGERRALSIEEVMTLDPLTISTSSRLTEAARLMREADTGALIVVDENDRVEGILTDRDIALRAVAEDRDPSQTRVGEIASTDLEALSPRSSIQNAVRLMREHAVRRLPVVEEGRPVGIVSIGDLAEDLDPRSALADISKAPADR